MPSVDDLLKRAGTISVENSNSFNVGLYHKTVFQQRMLEYLNRFVQAESDSDDESAEREKAAFEGRWEEFCSSGAGGHANPNFAIPIMRGVALNTFGEPQAAQKFVTDALAAASNDFERAVAFHNMASSFILMRLFEDAVTPAATAVELDPRNQGFWANLCIAYFHTDKTAAAKILIEVERRGDYKNPTSIWRLSLLSDLDFLEMEGFEPYDRLVHLIKSQASSKMTN